MIDELVERHAERLSASQVDRACVVVNGSECVDGANSGLLRLDAVVLKDVREDSVAFFPGFPDVGAQFVGEDTDFTPDADDMGFGVKELSELVEDVTEVLIVVVAVLVPRLG